MADKVQPFRDRLDAGRQLGRSLRTMLPPGDCTVLALPRGGVPVGYAVARALRLPLDILLVRKLGVPGNEEYAMGAVGSGGVRVLSRTALASRAVTPALLDAACARELRVLALREAQFRADRPPPALRSRTALLVDDGLATGSTMRAAIAVARASQPAALIVAVPVGAPDSCAAIEREVERLVCLVRPPRFEAVSHWYRQFEQTSDDEVQHWLARAWAHEATRSPMTGRHAL